jgi:hypothetical protein
LHGLPRPVNTLARHAAGLIRSCVRAFGSVGRLSCNLLRLLGGLPGAFADLTRSSAGSLPGFLSGLTRTLADLARSLACSFTDLPSSLASALANVSNTTTDIFGSFARTLDGLASAFAYVLDR